MSICLICCLEERVAGYNKRNLLGRDRQSVSQRAVRILPPPLASQSVSFFFYLPSWLQPHENWTEEKAKSKKTNKQPPASPKTELLCRCHVPPARRKALPRPSSFSSPLSFFSTCLSVTGRLSCCRVLLACGGEEMELIYVWKVTEAFKQAS